jgi:hypothetical protein
MLKCRSNTCLSKKDENACKFEIIIGLEHENTWDDDAYIRYNIFLYKF